MLISNALINASTHFVGDREVAKPRAAIVDRFMMSLENSMICRSVRTYCEMQLCLTGHKRM